MSPKERYLVVGALGVQSLLLAIAAWINSPVMDELPHLAAGIVHWEFGSFEPYRVNPPLVRSVAAVPVLIAGAETEILSDWESGPFERPEFLLGRRFVEANGARSFWLFRLARWSCLPFMWLGGYLCYRWSRDLYGPIGGVFSLMLWCMCPNLLAWGATICPDAPAAAMGLAAGYAFWRWLEGATWPRAALAGSALGLALLTKSTWLILLGLWPALWIAGRFTRSSQRLPTAEFLSILLLGVYVLNLGYGFAGSFRPLGQFEFISQALAGRTSPSAPGNRFRTTILENVPVPLPADFVLGLDQQQFDFELGRWSYLRAEQKRGGWWYYYLYALGVKTPIGTLLLLILAAVSPLLAGLRRAKSFDELLVIAPAVVLIAIVSSYTGFNRYLRYVLPAVPFFFVWGGRVSCLFTAGLRNSLATRLARGCVVACASAAAISSLMIWPHSMSYFNELVGGPRYGHRHLLDANIDWGQDLLALKKWIDAHPGTRPFHLQYFGWIHPRTAGIEALPIPRLIADDQGNYSAPAVAQVAPGWYAISVNYVTGYRHSDNNPPLYKWLLEFEPVDRIGYSIWIYHLTEQEIADWRMRR